MPWSRSSSTRKASTCSTPTPTSLRSAKRRPSDGLPGAMALDRILLSRFRNHRDTAITGTARFNLLVGENGAGKTNVLEAISLFAPGRGLRRAALTDMPAQGGNGSFAVSAELATRTGPVRLGTGVAPERPGRRIVQVN